MSTFTVLRLGSRGAGAVTKYSRQVAVSHNWNLPRIVYDKFVEQSTVQNVVLSWRQTKLGHPS